MTVAGVTPPTRTPAVGSVPRLLPIISATQAGERPLLCDAALTTPVMVGMLWAKTAQAPDSSMSNRTAQL